MLLDVIHILILSLSPIPQYRNVLYVSAVSVSLIMLNLFRCFGELTIEEYLIFFHSSHFVMMLFIIILALVSVFFFLFSVNVDTEYLCFIRCHFLTYLRLYTRHQLTGSIVGLLRHLVPFCFGLWIVFLLTWVASKL